MIFHIALKDLKVIFRDRKALAIMLLMPALIMLILGTALGSVFSSDIAIKKFAIGVVNNDGGSMSQVFINKVLRGDVSDMIDTYVVSEEKADSMLKNKTVPAIVVIPVDFSKNIESSIPVKIAIKSQIDDQFNAKVVQSVTESFAQSMSQAYAVANAEVDVFNKYQLAITKPMEGMSDTDAVMYDLQKKLSKGILEFAETNQEKTKTVSAMQYYSAAMLVMFILFGVNFGTKLMVEERGTKTLGRIMSASVGKTALLTGKFLGLICIGLLQSLILIIFTRLFYGVSWGNSIPGVMLVTFSAVFAGSGLGMFIAAVAKTVKAADGIGSVFIQTFTLIGGGMIPVYVMPDKLKKLAKVTLNWWATQGYQDLMYGANWYTILPYCGILVAMGIAYLGVGILRFRIE